MNAILETLKRFLTFKSPPPYYSATLITVLLVLGEWRYDILGGYDRMVAALATAVVAEAALSLWLRGTWPRLVSAYISGNSVLMLVKPAAAPLWPFAIAAFVSIASKYVLRYRGRHLWNPTNFGVTALLFLAPTQVTPLSHQWGNEPITLLVIYAIGLIVVTRARVVHITLTYVAAFAAFAWLRSTTGYDGWLLEMGPLSGPMYTLFIFFMVTDPRTIVSNRTGQYVVTIAVAALEALIRMGLDRDISWLQSMGAAPALFALFIVGPPTLWWELRKQAAPRSPAAPALAAAA
jgi:Na+-transporting NADH:ubiquinone oxidoreductase subunit NqrB